MRPTRTREITMKKINHDGYKQVIGNEGAPFVNAASAILAMQALQFVVAMQGYSTYGDIDMGNGKVEVRVHLDNTTTPSIPQGYTFTQREITSQHYYDKRKHIAYELRVVTYIFKYNK